MRVVRRHQHKAALGERRQHLGHHPGVQRVLAAECHTAQPKSPDRRAGSAATRWAHGLRRAEEDPLGQCLSASPSGGPRASCATLGQHRFACVSVWAEQNPPDRSAIIEVPATVDDTFLLSNDVG